MQPQFLFKYHYGIRQVPLLAVRHPMRTRVVRHVKLPGLGNIPVTESTGRPIAGELTLMLDDHHSQTLFAKADEIRSHLRRLRQEEADQLDQIDAQIVELRAKREQVIKLAWQKSHTVTVKELTDRIGKA